MSFNPDKSKQVQEVKFSHKTQRVIHPSAIFSNMLVVCSSFQKHLGIYLDEKLNFPNHIKGKISKANKGIGILRKLYNVLPRNSLITIYKFFIQPPLEYAIIFDQPENESFCEKHSQISNEYQRFLGTWWLKVSPHCDEPMSVCSLQTLSNSSPLRQMKTKKR